MFLSAFGFALMAFFVRLCDDCGGPVSSFQKSFFRNAIALLVAAVAFARARRSGAPARLPAWGADVWRGLVLRATFGTVGIFANFYALSHVPIAEGQTLNKTAPFFTVFFAWLFLGEKVRARQVVTLLLAFVGALLVAKPGFAGEETLPLAAGLLGGIAAGAAYTCVRALRARQVDPSFIILFFSAFSCLATIPFLLCGFDPMTGRQLLVLVGAGVGASIGQFGITLAYGYAAPKDVAVCDYSNVLFTAALGLAFFGQVPDPLSCLGFVVILLAAVRLHHGDTPAGSLAIKRRMGL